MNTGRVYVAVFMLVAGTIAWAALPMDGLGLPARLALVGAICFGVLGLFRLAAIEVAGSPAQAGLSAAPLRGSLYEPLSNRIWQHLTSVLVTVPWPQLMVVAVLALEALHPRQPWHTAVLGLLLLGYLFVLHLAETAARLAVLRPQLPLIAAGICLAGLSVAAAELPVGAASTGSGWLAVLAAIAAIVAAALVLPI
jgi:hypothetical protein